MSPTGRRPMSRTPGSLPCCSTSPGGCRTTAGCPVEIGIAGLLAVNAFGINWVTTTRSDLVYVTLGLLLVLRLIRGRLSLRPALALGLAVIVGIGGLTALRGGGASEGGSGLSIAFGVKSSLLNRNGFDLGKTLLVTDAVPM